MSPSGTPLAGSCFVLTVDGVDWSIERDAGGWYGVSETGEETPYFATDDDVCDFIDPPEPAPYA